MFAHIDVDAFYANCETVFRPDLKQKPVIVLSNNDGIIIARSQEAKTLGIKMGQPFHELSSTFLNKNHVAVFSSNYPFYADMSDRVMTTLHSLVPAIEVYSIDEAFCKVPHLDTETSLSTFGQTLKQTIQQYTHLSVSVGFAQTKTLAKLANYAAKKWFKTGNVLDFSDRYLQKKLMSIVPISEVWGIGRQLTKRLNVLGINTIWDLASLSPAEARKKFSVTLERTVRELNGECCINLAEIKTQKDQIICSRSFGEKTSDFSEVREAICNYIFRAAERLRAQGQYCQQVTVFLKTSIYSRNVSHINDSASECVPLTHDTRVLIKAACRVLKRLWRQDHPYYTAGVILKELSEVTIKQLDLFTDPYSYTQASQLMSTVDAINRSRTGSLFVASQGTKRRWRMKQIYLSPAYTTRIQDIPIVKI